MNKIASLLIATTIFVACKSNKETSAAISTKESPEGTPSVQIAEQPAVATEAQPVTSTPADQKNDSTSQDLYRFIVSFYSIGSGTENSYMKSFESLISTFSTEKGKSIDYEKTPYGREGETDYCLRLNELTAAEQTDFIKQANETLKGAKWVHVYENQPCMHKRK